MKIGVWNIDHPEIGTRSRAKQDRYERIVCYLQGACCDIYVLTETNSALQLPGYKTCFSDESPFKRKSRSYAPPNRYHQVGIYSRFSISKMDIAEPINGVLGRFPDAGVISSLYGNAVTIKDQWKKDSPLKYTDRLNEQISAINSLPDRKTIVAGDFNLRLGWPQKAFAHEALGRALESREWVWPTKSQTSTVQHVLHTPDISIEFSLDQNVKETSSAGPALSDHPFLLVNVSD
jgi:Endonuclease/Exonuclease/phosphatase family